MSQQKDIHLTKEFPYKDNYTSENDIYDRFEAVQEYTPKFKEIKYIIHNLPNIKPLYKGKPKIMIVSNDFDNDDISDFFFEEERIKARRYDQVLNLQEWWQDYGWRYTRSQTKKSRERIYNKYHEVTTFRPSVMAGMIEFLRIDSVLDFSAGWGDRLIGCLAKNISKYTGIDPNTRLKYEQIKPFFEREFRIRTKVKFYHLPAEEVELKKGDMYDIIFTSPPYFNLEVYTDDETQSIYQRNVSEWLNEFLIDTIDKFLPHIKKYIVLVINDPPPETGINYVEEMIDILNNDFPELSYQGVISYAKPNLKSPQPMWIWQVK